MSIGRPGDWNRVITWDFKVSRMLSFLKHSCAYTPARNPMTQDLSCPAATNKSLPSGISYIIGNEAAERFSFYGMKGILVVFMTSYLWLMGTQASGEPMPDAEARAWYHLFTGSVYLTPFLGAILADAWLGKYRTIMLLSCVYCLGHALLALVGLDVLGDGSLGSAQLFLVLGLGTIALGSGGIKPCVSAHVGDQFSSANAHWLSKVFGWFYIAINLGAFTSNLLTPWLLKWYGPHWAFGVPGVLMAIATMTFYLGRRRFVHVPPQGRRFFREAFGAAGLKTLAQLAVLYAFVAVFWALFDQTGSSWVLQAENMNRHWLGVTWLESQIQAINPIMILVLVPLFSVYLYPAINRRWTLTPLRKIAIGLFVMVPGFALVALIQGWIDAGERPSIGWQVLAYVILTASEVMVSITCLEFSYTQSPKKMKSLVMATFLASVTLGNYFTMGVNWFIQIDSSKPAAGLVEAIVSSRAKAVAGSELATQKSGEGFEGYRSLGSAGFILAYEHHGQKIESQYSPTGVLVVTSTPGSQALASSSEKIEILSEKNPGNWLSEVEGNRSLKTTIDDWGQALRYDVLSASHARVSSAGPDKLWQTSDDLNRHLYKKSANAVVEQESWLNRRRKSLGISNRPSFSTDPSPVVVRLEVGGGTRLEGAAYFWFFTLLMLGTAFLFLPIVRFYSPKQHLQDQPLS